VVVKGEYFFCSRLTILYYFYIQSEKQKISIDYLFFILFFLGHPHIYIIPLGPDEGPFREGTFKNH